MKKLRIFRVILALLFFFGITALFVDPTHSVAKYLGWMAKLQFWPACLALSLIALAIVAATLVFGRIYCSVICPLGILQDFAIRLRGLFARRGFPVGVNSPKKARTAVRILALLAFVSGGFLGLHFAWLEPYAIYGRLASVTAAPLGRIVNNQLATLLEKHGCYIITVENVMPPVAFIVFAASLAALVLILAVWKGRFWCNTICPVGTVLGFMAKFAWLRPRIDAATCVSCKACERKCKGRCIDVESKKIDATRCVACYDCSAVCPKGAIKWK